MSDAGQQPPTVASGQKRGPDLDPSRCVEVVEFVTDYLDGVLTPVEVARLDAHLAQCDPCIRYIEQVRETIRAAERVEPEAVPPDVLERLLRVYRELRGA